jgi:hypothetical protein
LKKNEDKGMNSKYFALIILILLAFTQTLIGQNIHFYPQTDTVHAVDGCTGAEFTCTLSSFNNTDSIIITPGFNTYFEYLNNLGFWLPIDRVYFLIEDTLNTFQYELLYWPLGPIPYFTQIFFDSAYTAWDRFFKIIVVVSSIGTVVDSASQVFKAQIGLGIEDGNPENIPDQITLYPNYPNPFNNSTTIRYYLPQRSKIKLTVYNALGQSIEVLINEKQPSGHQTINWHTKEVMTSGIYYIKLENGRHRTIRKCILLK